MPSEVEGAAAVAPDVTKPEDAKTGDAKGEDVKGEDVKMEDAVKEEKGEEKVDATEEHEKGEGDPEAADKAQEPEDAPGQPEPSEPPPPPPPTELADAPEDSRARVKGDEVCLDIAGATPNVMPSADGRMLFSLCDGGLQYLLAGVKSTVGLKAGCYMFEVRIVEMLNPYEGRGGRDGQGGARTPQPRQQVRIGFSIAGTSPLLDEEAGKFYFDSDGHIVNGSNYSRVASRFGRDQCVALVLNLGDDPLAKTVSLFVDGRRASNPQPIPEDMVGQVLYPTITFKNVTLQVNFGLSPKMVLPFKCRMLKDASADDVLLTKVAPADGEKREVLVPIGLPDQGLFDWLDQFLEANPKFTELSDRKVLEWALRSGLSRARNYDHHASNDKPGMNFNVPMVDDLSIQKTLSAIVPALRRDFVVMELRDNLLAAERKKLLNRFPAADFKRVAVVAIGEPTKEYKERVQTLMLTEKKKEHDDKEREKRRRQEEEDWHRAKQGRYDRGRQQDEGKEDPAAEKEEPKDESKDEAKDDGKEEQKEGNEEAKDAAKDDVKDGEKAIELTPEEAALWYRKSNVPDLTHKSLANSYADFTLPTQDEGFDEVRYVWQEAAKCSEVLKGWVLEKKKTQKVENLEPGEWFKEKWDAWSAQLSDWKRKQNESKDALRKKGANKNLDKKADGEEKKDGEDGNEDGKKEEDDGDKSGELDEDDIDPFTHENLDDMGNGKPLYGNFVYEDWTLLSTRYEMHLLVHAFRRDLNDPDRQSFQESHLSFYYGKYYKKSFNIKQFGVESLEDLVALIKDTISINAETSFIEAVLPEDVPLDKFLRYAEDHRRERQRCIDAGDETASLKFTRPAPAPPKGQSGYGKGSGADDRGGRQHYDRRGDRGGGRNDRGSGGQQGGYSQRGGSNWGGDRGGYGGDSRGGYSDNRGGDSRSGRGGDRGSYKGDRGGYSGDRVGSGGGYQGGGSKGGSSKRGYQAPPGPPPSNYPPAKQPRYDTSRSGPPPPRGGDPRGSRAGGGGSRNTGGGGGGYGGGGSRGYR